MFLRPRGACLAWLCAALVLAAPAGAQKKSKPKKSSSAAAKSPAKLHTGLESLESAVRQFSLPNGLSFIVVERHQAPVFSFSTVVDAGSVNDRTGTTGLAHMMEHMAFKGTARIGTRDYAKEKPLLDAEDTAWNAVLDERRRGARADTAKLRRLERDFTKSQDAAHEVVVSNEFSKWVEQAGGQDMNAGTASDWTEYHYSMPSNRLELWALLEGSRMTAPVFREFYKEREVVYEERRMNYESTPFGRLLLEFTNAAFAAHPYGNGGIGFPSDLKTFTRPQGEEYFREHYVAKNMTVAVVGDVALADVKKNAEKYFGQLSDAPKPPPVDTVEPEQRAERRLILEDPGQPLLLLGWHIPAASDPTYPAYEALADLLAGGDYARLIKTLVKEKKVCTRIDAGPGFPGDKYPSLFVIFVEPAAGQDPAKIEQQVNSVLDEIATTRPFTNDELAGYRVRVRAGKIAAVEHNDQLAGDLAHAQILYGDWHEFFREQERIQRLEPKDVMDAMKRVMTPTHRTVAMIVNRGGPASGEGAK